MSEMDMDNDVPPEPEPYEQMSEREFGELLEEALYEHAENYEREDPVVSTFEQEGLLTGNKGIVVRLGEMEFYVTIVRRH
jgi:hypothetical protein